jgi:hypothetical protein
MGCCIPLLYGTTGASINTCPGRGLNTLSESAHLGPAKVSRSATGAVSSGWNKAGHPLPCGRSSATFLTCVFSSQHFSSYPASSGRDVPSLCPASITSRYGVWSMPGPRVRASSSRSQVPARGASAAARVACDRPSASVRWRPPSTAAALRTDLVACGDPLGLYDIALNNRICGPLRRVARSVT